MDIEESILRIFKVAQFININKDNSIFTTNEIDEQNDNIEELQEIIKKLNITLENIEKYSAEDNERLSDEILQLHLILCDIEWQYDQIHDMIRKIGIAIEDKN